MVASSMKSRPSAVRQSARTKHHSLRVMIQLEEAMDCEMSGTRSGHLCQGRMHWPFSVATAIALLLVFSAFASAQLSYFEDSNSVLYLSMLQEPGGDAGGEEAAEEEDDEPPPRRDNTPGVPKISGHFFSTQSFALWSPALKLKVTGELPVPGRVKVAENNSAMPDNRIFFTYNHFHNAVQSGFVDISDPLLTVADERRVHAERYTVGFEKMLFDGNWSVEMRMPIVGINESVVNPGFYGSGMGVGNLAILNKFLLYRDYTTAFSVGTSVSAPTGQDATLIIDQEIFRVRNEAVHLTPFVGFLHVPNDRWFYQGFTEIDIPLGGNRVDARDLPTGNELELGVLNAQTVACFDLSIGRWWYRDPFAPNVTAVSTLFELHYATSLEDADSLVGTATASNYDFGNFRNRFDAITLTVGMDVEIRNRVNLRLAGMLPLTGRDDRFFDSEIQAFINWRFR